MTFTEERPNPLYRRLCYTAAWSNLITFAVLNLVGIVDAIVRGKWRLAEIYYYGWIPTAGVCWVLGLRGILPRTQRSTVREWAERRVFYGTIWTVTCSQVILGILWRGLLTKRSRSRWANVFTLATFVGSLAGIAVMASRGRLPRTRRIVTRAELSA